MDFDIGNLVYIVLTLIFLIVGALGKKKKPDQQQVGLLARVLKERELQDIYIKPVIRKELESLWERFDKYKDSEIEGMDIELE